MGKNILILTGDGGECYEVLYGKHRFQEAGYKPLIAAPSKRSLHLVQHDFEPGWDTYIERAGYAQDADLSLEEVKVKDFDALLIPGGRAPEYLRHNKLAKEITRQFHTEKKWIFAICHGVQIMITAGIIKGMRLTCYEHVRSEVECNGGTFISEQAVRDGHVVTGQTWQSHPEFYREVFKCLQS